MESKRSPLDFINLKKTKKDGRYVLPSWPTAALLITGVLAAPIAINLIEFGRGFEDRPGCADNIDINFTYAIGTDTTISAVNLDNIGLACAGRFLRLTLTDSSDNELSETVWQMPSAETISNASGVATISAIVNRSSSNTNGLVGSVYRVFPGTATLPTVASSDVTSVDYFLSETDISVSPSPSASTSPSPSPSN